MKTKIQILALLILTLFSCRKEIDKSQSPLSISKETKEITLTENTENDFDKILRIYKYTSNYSDSTLVTELKYKNNEIVNDKEPFYHTLPFQSEFVRNETIKNAKGQKTYERFDSLMCEVGGTSAWNKYVFKYNQNKEPVEIKHYKAWWNEGIDFKRPEKPKYFLGEKLKYKYLDNVIEQFAYDINGKIIEKITKEFDINGRLVFENWDAWDSYRFKVFYEYKN